MQHGGGRVITASDSLLSARPPQGFSADDHDDDEDQNDDDYEIMVFVMRMMVNTVRMANKLRRMFLVETTRTRKLRIMATAIAMKVPSNRLFCRS